MKLLKKGDIVGRKSYKKDVLFEIINIVKTSDNRKLILLKGITERIEADSYEEDLEKVDKRTVADTIKKEEDYIIKKINNYIKNPKNSLIKNNKEDRSNKEINTGKILHLDGDRRYSEKSTKYYKSLGLNAIVKNIQENKQPQLVISLLEKYKPDILVITGHDGMIKKGTNYNDIYNYRNSKYFVATVKEARKWNYKNLAIFAGACQSYYEEIMLAGANFASSPARIMIDFIDPLIVAEKIATTDYKKYLTISDIEDELRDGRKGIDGIGTMGKKNVTN